MEKTLAPRTSFDDLPQTLQHQIFSHLDLQSRAMARATCFDWAIMVKDLHGVHLGISNSNVTYFPKLDYGQEVKEVTLLNLTTQLPEPYPVSKYVKILEVTEAMNVRTTLDFLQSCPSLQHLIFTSVKFEDVPTEPFDVEENFKPPAFLKSIHISIIGKECCGYSDNEIYILNILQYFNLDKLESFTLQREGSNISSNYEFTIAHKKKWKLQNGSVIRLNEPNTVFESVTHIIRKSRETLKYLHLENVARLYFFVYLAVPMPALLELVGVIRYKYGWVTLLSEQCCLTVLRLELFHGVWGEVQECIKKCTKTLKELKLFGFFGALPGTKLELNFLANLPKLKILYVEAPQIIKDVQLLPRTLEILLLDSPLSKEDFYSIIGTFDNLKIFCLKNYGFTPQTANQKNGWIPTEILDLEMFEYLINSPKLKKIVFEHSMMRRMDIVKFCEERNWIRQRSEYATVNILTIGYLYNMEVDIDNVQRKTIV